MRQHQRHARREVLGAARLEGVVVVVSVMVRRTVRAGQHALTGGDEATAALTLQHSMAGAALTDAGGTVRSANPALARWCAATPEAMVGRVLGDLVHPGDADAVACALDRGPDGRRDVEVRLLSAEEDRWVRLLVVHLPPAAPRPALCVLTVEDVTEHRATTERLAHDALHDTVTALVNRRGIDAELSEVLASPGCGGTLVMVDLDGFKAVNDRLGHDAGDELLRVVAGRLRGCLRPGDVAGRWGGDELVVIARGVGDDAGAEAVGRRVLDAVVGPVRLRAGGVGLRASIGVRRINAGERDGAAVVRDADAALYRAKRAGGCTARLADVGEGAISGARCAPLTAGCAEP